MENRTAAYASQIYTERMPCGDFGALPSVQSDDINILSPLPLAPGSTNQGVAFLLPRFLPFLLSRCQNVFRLSLKRNLPGVENGRPDDPWGESESVAYRKRH